MIVSKLEITGFRGISYGSVRFGQFSVLVGPNNCGKTTITEALALVLGRDRLVRALTEHDFFGSTPVASDRVRIVATLTGFDPNDPDQHPDWFRDGRGIVKWFDVDTGMVKLVSEKATDLLSCQIAYCARFDHDSLETISIRHFFDADTGIDPFDEDSPAITVPNDLIREIGFFLVPASRSWDRMISFGSELFRRVVAYVGGKPAAAVLAERDRLRTPSSPLEADENLAELTESVNADLKSLFGQPSELKLRITSTDSDGILDAVFPHFSKGDGVPLPAKRHGSGLISIQTLVLLMRFGKTRVERGDGFMMAIEEPELHVPPSQQRKLLRLLQTMTTQTIVTTHSPTVASMVEAHQVGLAVNDDGKLSVRPLLTKPLAHDADNPIRHLMLSGRDTTIEALMNPNVLIPEGKTDANWLRLFVKSLELKPSEAREDGLAFAHLVGVISTPDARIADTFRHLTSVHPSVFCLVDGDLAGTNYINTLCHSQTPPSNILRWPDNWEIEHIVNWIVGADPTILNSAELQTSGVASNYDELLGALSGNLKRNGIVHALLVDAMSGSEQCLTRIAHVLRLFADVAGGKEILAGAATNELKANGVTRIWTFNNDFQGI